MKRGFILRECKREGVSEQVLGLAGNKLVERQLSNAARLDQSSNAQQPKLVTGHRLRDARDNGNIANAKVPSLISSRGVQCDEDLQPSRVRQQREECRHPTQTDVVRKSGAGSFNRADVDDIDIAGVAASS